MAFSVRETVSSDIPALEEVLNLTDLFPSSMLPAMLTNFLSGDASDELFLTCSAEGRIVGFCYAKAEALAGGTWNMLALALLPSLQRKAYGSGLVCHLEERLRARDRRVLIVDTSAADAYSRTRAFYLKNAYVEEARIRDFWAKGEDKIVFWKAL